LLHERLSIVLVGEGRPREALDELMRERRERPRDATVLQRIGMVYQALGDRQAARRAYARALELDPGFQPARDSLGATGTD
jgi:Flp pilus assembly protein TadD